jgi:alkanesulfonate monooxygenase SsuD/methylene tetrahydromethanopterin reductase-like flavin-dependent oxidoreductase (luciferase family)
LRFGVVILPEWRWSDAAAVWRHADNLRFDHAWTYDHLAWRTMRDEAWFGAIPTLTAAAAVTSRLRLGTLVASITFRHPVPFAKELVTLDDISGGRLTLGIGAGGSGFDAAMLGEAVWPARERGERFVEFVELLDRLLRNPAVSYAGRYYRAVEARTYPGCVQQPRVPLAIAATGPTGLALAARLADLWVTTGPRASPTPLAPKEGTAAVRAQMARLDDACAAAGRDPRTLRRLVLTGPELDPSLSSVGAFEDGAAAYAAIGVTDYVVHWPRPSGPFAADQDTFEHIFS